MKVTLKLVYLKGNPSEGQKLILSDGTTHKICYAHYFDAPNGQALTIRNNLQNDLSWSAKYQELQKIVCEYEPNNDGLYKELELGEYEYEYAISKIGEEIEVIKMHHNSCDLVGHFQIVK